MKSNFFKSFILGATIFALGAGVTINQNKSFESVYAAQHEDNFAEYTYSGSYYSSITSELTNGLHGTLRTTLSNLILPKEWYTYSGSSYGTLGNVLQSADEDPTNNSNMILFYTRDSITKSASTVNNKLIWNREHVWPQNLSNGNWTGNSGKEKAGADLLHIRPTYEATNSARGSERFGNNDHKGVVKYNGMPYAYTSGGYFEPIDAVKGDVARILMYVWTAYRDYYNDSSLVITKAIENYDVLLQWHMMDKPDALEGHRNDFSETSKQKNRNPFVDHPEYAWKIFGECATPSVTSECKTVYPEKTTPTPPGPISSSSSSAPISSSEESVISSSSEAVVSSSSVEEASSSSAAPSEEKKMKHGCNGSVIAVSAITGFAGLVGLVFTFSKKKKK